MSKGEFKQNDITKKFLQIGDKLIKRWAGKGFY